MSDSEKAHATGNEHGSQPASTFLHLQTGIRGIYYHPLTQVVMLGFVCFMCPGSFNALNGLGGGGQRDATTGANANAALYATFAFTAFFAGFVCLAFPTHGFSTLTPSSSERTINNKLGSRLTLLLGTIGYALYIGSFLYATHSLPYFASVTLSSIQRRQCQSEE
jgi:hypothetical protein